MHHQVAVIFYVNALLRAWRPTTLLSTSVAWILTHVVKGSYPFTPCEVPRRNYGCQAKIHTMIFAMGHMNYSSSFLSASCIIKDHVQKVTI